MTTRWRVNDHLLTSLKHLPSKFALNNNQRSKLENLTINRQNYDHPMDTFLKPIVTPARRSGAVHTWCPSTSAWVPAHNGVVSTSWVSDTDRCSLLPRQTPLETSRALQQVQSTRFPPEVTKKVCT